MLFINPNLDEAPTVPLGAAVSHADPGRLSVHLSFGLLRLSVLFVTTYYCAVQLAKQAAPKRKVLLL